MGAIADADFSRWKTTEQNPSYTQSTNNPFGSGNFIGSGLYFGDVNSSINNIIPLVLSGIHNTYESGRGGSSEGRLSSGPDFSAADLKGKSKEEIAQFQEQYIKNVNEYFSKYTDVSIKISDAASVDSAINSLNGLKSKLETDEKNKIDKINSCDKSVSEDLYNNNEELKKINDGSSKHFNSIDSQIQSAKTTMDNIDQTKYPAEYKKAKAQVTKLENQRAELQKKLKNEYEKKIKDAQSELIKNAKADRETQEKNIDTDIKKLGQVKKVFSQIEEAKASTTESVATQQGNFNTCLQNFTGLVNNSATPKSELKEAYTKLESEFNNIHGNTKSFKTGLDLAKSLYEKAMKEPNRPE